MDSPPILINGDALDILPTLPDCSVGAIVTDPPYELGFMGKGWDASGIAYSVDLWAECLRVLRPGGHLAAFGGTRTYHRMTCAIEDAGFEIRDSLTWLYGSGFPKSLDVGKAIDKAAGAEREVIGRGAPFGAGSMRNRSRVEQGYRPTELRPDGGIADITAPATPAAQQWQGWGTALKPAQEPIVLARKPLGGTVAANVLAHGTGALNIDGCRVEHVTVNGGNLADNPHLRAAINGGNGGHIIRSETDRRVVTPNAAGRWPSNVLLSHGEDCGDTCAPGCAVAELDAQSGNRPVAGSPSKSVGAESIYRPGQAGYQRQGPLHQDSGGASRYFPVFRYQAKAPAKERPKVDGVAHPTVKPLALMRWLVRLVTPPGGLVLDPFAGSGTTVEAALLEGFRVIAVEREVAYLPLIEQRVERVWSPR